MLSPSVSPTDISQEEDNFSNRTRRHPHVRTACDECRRRKRKCDEDTPCSRCVRHGLLCQRTRLDMRLATTQALYYNDPGLDRGTPSNANYNMFPAVPNSSAVSHAISTRGRPGGHIPAREIDLMYSTDSGGSSDSYHDPSSYTSQSSMVTYSNPHAESPSAALSNLGGGLPSNLTGIRYHHPTGAASSYDTSIYLNGASRAQFSVDTFPSQSYGGLEGMGAGPRQANIALSDSPGRMATHVTPASDFAPYAETHIPVYLPQTTSFAPARTSETLARGASEREGRKQASGNKYGYWGGGAS